MKVLKVYYNGNEFTYDKEMIDMPSETPSDETIHFVLNEKDAEGLIETLNNDLKKSVDEMGNYRDFIVRKCKDCGEYFVIREHFAYWCKEKGFNIPKRCINCRKKRKSK